MWYLRHEARSIARNPGTWIATTGLLSLVLWPLGLTPRVLMWMDSWGRDASVFLRLAWTAIGFGWVYMNNAGARATVERANSPTPSTSAIERAAASVDQRLVASHDAALSTLRTSIEPRLAGGAFRVANAGEPYTLVKTVILSSSGGSVPRGDTRARTMTAYLHRATNGPKYLIARVDIATGSYSEQPVDERHWGLLVG